MSEKRELAVNSIDKDDDGNYLVSSRHFHQLYKVDGTSGDLIWKMGGKDGEFTMNNGTNVGILSLPVEA